ncbi:MAG: FIST C-terminal domain-containing protein [Deltaproteobacteria bacterium]|jgi:hypothetical protein|nr:FIST C-terminal domain-containing protein [Deltaproteobacteria bacterium]
MSKVRMLIGHTLEPDDAERSVKEILGQLDLGRNQLRHSVGIVHCHQAFVESGALRAVCNRLPFPVVGYNTFLHSSSLGLVDHMAMTAAVLTSDTVKFATGLSAPMTRDIRRSTSSMYVETENLLKARPALGLVFAPAIPGVASGEIMTEALDEISDGVPFFGGQPADFTTYMRSPRVIHNGETYADRAATVLIEGEIRPRFNVYPVAAQRRIRQIAIVTESDENIVKQINGMPALEFMEQLGLCFEGQLTGTHTIPLFVNRYDGAPPIVRAILAQTPEGWLVLCGRVPVDSTLGIGAMDQEHILNGVKRITSLTRASLPDVFILYSCLSRNIVLGFNYTLEAESVREELGNRVPYVFAYASGEICPLPSKEGRWRNGFHNMSLVTVNF